MGPGHITLTDIALDMLLDIISYLTVKEIILLRLVRRGWVHVPSSDSSLTSFIGWSDSDV